MDDTAPQGSSVIAPPLQREMYFPTYIYFRDLEVTVARTFNAELEGQIRAWREEDLEGIVRSNVSQTGTWHSAVDMALRPEFRRLVDWVLSSAGEVAEDLGYHSDWSPEIANMWANIAPRHGYNRSHVHPHSLWSGVYYVRAPKEAGRIVFSEPRPQVRMASAVYARPAQERPESWEQVYFEPVEGRIILFPSWLLHEVEPNLTDLHGNAADRISVSFNLRQKRSVPT